MLIQLLQILKVWFQQIGGEKELKGQGLVEYALIIFLISVAVVAILTLLGDEIRMVFELIVATFGGSIEG